MALLICPDCGNSVSDAAQACTRCGRPRVRNGSPENWKRKHSLGGQIASTIAGLTLIVLTSDWSQGLVESWEDRNCFAKDPNRVQSRQDRNWRD